MYSRTDADLADMDRIVTAIETAQKPWMCAGWAPAELDWAISRGASRIILSVQYDSFAAPQRRSSTQSSISPAPRLVGNHRVAVLVNRLDLTVLTVDTGLFGLFGYSVGVMGESPGGQEHVEPVAVRVAVAAGESAVDFVDAVHGSGAAVLDRLVVK